MRKLLMSSLWAVLLACTLNSCKTDVMGSEESSLQPSAKTSNVSLTNPWKNNPYKLNLIYFVPNDVDTIPDYQKRLSNIMLQLQKFYGDNLNRAGFGNTSFGLDLLSDTRVNIITIKGNKGKASYPYDGGGGVVMDEVRQYFTLHPADKKSDHNLIIMPSYNSDPNNPGGPPFYGLGRDCFALDYPGMDTNKLGIGGAAGDLATKWIGGLAHELGHGLNAPHNKEHKLDQPVLGTALMGSGNYSYGKTPTFITNATAALFSTSQTFATATRSDWYASVNHNLTKLKGEFVNNKIVISGKFTSSLPVTVVNVYHDPFPAGGNKDYDALAWNTPPVNGDSFSVECPLNEFYTLSGDYELKLNFYHQNGTLVTYRFQYKFVNGVPEIEVINTKDLLDRTGWQAIATDSQETSDGVVGNILDGNNNSVWHTKWRGGEAPLPHHFIVDMQSATTVKGFAFANRSNLNGAMKDIEIFKSNDNTNWTSIGTYTLKAQQSWQYTDLPQAQSMRYVKVKVTATNGGFNYTHLAEFAAY
ncbi:TPA: discoidin domain-containing protein [Elizabethkingia meningoseptica]|uniref:discoidin domain-containing protein n=1 Tax=Elizabethkingia meningoseptica TaxID=238 RepID=UPI001FD425F8|nr:discoidin domain-containing protein [Elizabethkingia meningoseptica]